MEKMAQTLRETPDKIIFVCSSPYNILIAASLIMKADLYGRCALILPTYSPKNINYFKEIIHKMEQTGVICEVINKRNMLYRAVGLSDRENRVIMERVLKKLHSKKHEFFLVNHTWNKALVCYPACLWFRYCKQTIFIEEGSSQRATPDESPLILKGGYPSELLNILGIRFRFAIGICTSAIETAEAEIKINLNDNFLKDGKCELVPLDIR